MKLSDLPRWDLSKQLVPSTTARARRRKKAPEKTRGKAVSLPQDVSPEIRAKLERMMKLLKEVS
jgi:hypothetical protein